MEGNYTGIPTAWIRFFGCNFECRGFGQSHLPRDQWRDPAKEIDLTNIKSLEELPVLEYSCDSAYSWSKKFAHLAHQGTASEICDGLENILRNEHNPEGKFLHPKTNQYIHMAFTGGEPMMQQTAIVDILTEFEKRDNLPAYCTVETNGTQEARPGFSEFIVEKFSMIMSNRQWFWSCSPKLSSSGEPWEKAIQPGVLAGYDKLSKQGQLKFVVDGTEEVWAEVEKATALYREAGVMWPVFIMPVGATEKQQEDIQAAICEECFRRGYNFSARLHNWIFSNAIGK